MIKINIIDQGFVYKNPKPYLRSANGYFPSVVECDSGGLVASVVMGEAFEAVNLHCELFRSKDKGITWDYQGCLYEYDEKTPVSSACRISKSNSGELVAFIVQHDRTLTDQGLTNPENMGFVPVKLLMSFSNDNGYTWTKPTAFKTPLTGPEFEICSPVTFLHNKCLLPTSTWRGWDGYCPEGMKMVAFVSYDQGRTWPEYVDVMDKSKESIIFWESKIIKIQDDLLLATAWCYDEKTGSDLENSYAVSKDGGVSFENLASTGLKGQTLTPLYIGDGKILCAYRRIDKKGLWLNISTLENGSWINMEEIPLWGTDMDKLTEHGKNMSSNFKSLKFGAPHMLMCSDNSIFLTFWCVEDGSGMIRYIKFICEN